MAAAEALESGPATDEELVGRVTGGDESAFEILYERYFPRVYRFVDRRLSNRADTEETVQEVFINIFSSIGSYRREAPFSAWVLGLARRTIANRFKKKRHPTVPLDAEEESEGLDHAASVASPLEHYECRERIRRMERSAAEELSPEQRRLFELHHLEHRSIHDLALAFAKSEDAVKSHLYRARKLLLAR